MLRSLGKTGLEIAPTRLRRRCTGWTIDEKSLCPFALCAAFQHSLVGRDSHDSYGHSVPVKVALRRESRGTSLRYVLATL